MVDEKCPNCGQFKFKKSFWDNNPGCGVWVAGFIIGIALTFFRLNMIGNIIFGLFFIIGIFIMLKKSKNVTYECENCKFKKEYLKE